MSADFRKMIEILLKQKPEFNAEQIKDLIEEKKRKIGAGYLTDQGALFLVAADLGVSFDNVPRVGSGIKDLYIGAKEVTIVSRLMNIYPIRRFNKKDTNELIATRTLNVYDGEAKAKVKLWDSQVNIPDEMGLQPGDLIKISKGYVKSGLDGKPIINLGSSGVIEPVGQDDASIPSLESIIITIDDISEPKDGMVVVGKISSAPRLSEFNNIRGEPSKSLQMTLSNESNTKSVRAIIWNVEENRIPKVFSEGSKVKLVGVKIKAGNPQYGGGDLEIHGDEGTMMEFSGSQKEIDVMPLRIISVGEETGKGSINCLGVDRSGRFISIIIDTPMITDSLETGIMIECVPSRIFGNMVIITKDDSYIRVMEDDPTFPKPATFESKIKNIQVSENPYFVEAIVLQAPNTVDINTKSGQTIPMADTLIGDDTGEVRLVGWRNQSLALTKMNVGDRIKVMGALASPGREGKMELTLKQYSSIIKLS